jgi:hypothetical protein
VTRQGDRPDVTCVERLKDPVLVAAEIGMGSLDTTRFTD